MNLVLNRCVTRPNPQDAAGVKWPTAIRQLDRIIAKVGKRSPVTSRHRRFDCRPLAGHDPLDVLQLRLHRVGSTGLPIADHRHFKRRIGIEYRIDRGQIIHEVGTTRMGADPATSVTNQYAQTWDIPNLIITDGGGTAVLEYVPTGP